MTEDWKKEAFEAWTANRALQEAMWRKANPGKARLYLESAPDDPPTFSVEYQAELRNLIAALEAKQIEAHASFMTMDAVDAHGGYIGEFTLLVQAVGPALGVIAGAWFQSKAARKVRLKDGDIEVEARTVEEIAELLDMAEKQRQKRQEKEES